jgi:hypothetical protein
LHKSAFPSAVRGALNDAAFDVKTRSMPHQANIDFVNRAPNFFKANSRFENATGFAINSMKSTVGFVDTTLKSGHNFAIRELEQQESGGTIDKKSFIPMDEARSGTNKNRLVKPNARLKSIKNIVVQNKASGKSEGQKFAKSVAFAGVGGFVLGTLPNGKKILWRVNSINKTAEGKFKLTAMYSFREDRTVHVKPTNFMKVASISSGNRIENFYIKQAERQIKKFE